MSTWFPRALFFSICGVVAVSMTGSASAQTDTTCSQFNAIVSGVSGQYLTSWHENAVRALSDQTPPSCSTARAQIDLMLSRIARSSEWRALDVNGQLTVVEPPVAITGQREEATFRNGLTAEMMLARPSVEDVNLLHPRRARQRNQVGIVILEGRVTFDGSLVWRVSDEAPIGWDFADAAVRVGALFRAPTEYEGHSTVGASFTTAIAFTAPPIYVAPYE